MAPNTYVKRNAVDVGLDLAAGATSVHSANVHGAALGTAERADRVKRDTTTPGVRRRAEDRSRALRSRICSWSTTVARLAKLSSLFWSMTEVPTTEVSANSTVLLCAIAVVLNALSLGRAWTSKEQANDYRGRHGKAAPHASAWSSRCKRVVK